MHKINPDIPLMCELHITVKLFTAACSFSDADSHSFSNQRILVRASSFVSLPLHENIYIRLLGCQMENEVGIVRKFCGNKI